MAAFVPSGLATAPSRRAAARRCACRGRPAAGAPAAAGRPAGPPRRAVAPPTASAAAESPAAEPLVGSADRAAALPWRVSVAGEEFPLLFMDFIVHMLGVMRAELTGVTDLPFEESLSLQTGKKRPARIESWNFSADGFRKIRATYIDAGLPAQVFNSVWYPDPAYDLPLLGIDFLAFGKKRVLCILDFQPLSQERAYLDKYIAPLAAIKAKYPGLAGKMSSRFYDENRFFSQELAFGKFDNAEPITAELYPAFVEYLAEYIRAFKAATPETDPAVIAATRAAQADYDQYSAERDPAVGLFSTYFGPAWAEAFTHEFLFADSVPVAKEKGAAKDGAPAAPGGGGGEGPPPAAAPTA